MQRKVAVNYDDLKSYLEEYHNPRPNGNCKADGQVWPCTVYLNLRAAIDRPADVWYR